MKKVTFATVKSFVKKNSENLHIKFQSNFDGMTDCVEQYEEPKFIKAKFGADQEKHTLGIYGAWFVGSSRDYFRPIYDGEKLTAVKVSNCCGSFTLAI